MNSFRPKGLIKMLRGIRAAETFIFTTVLATASIVVLTLSVSSRDVTAKPAYSQSTGYACAKCHTGAPSKTTVNAFGKAWQSKQK